MEATSRVLRENGSHSPRAAEMEVTKESEISRWSGVPVLTCGRSFVSATPRGCEGRRVMLLLLLLLLSLLGLNADLIGS